jgi:hypothetical protein
MAPQRADLLSHLRHLDVRVAADLRLLIGDRPKGVPEDQVAAEPEVYKTELMEFFKATEFSGPVPRFWEETKRKVQKSDPSTGHFGLDSLLRHVATAGRAKPPQIAGNLLRRVVRQLKSPGPWTRSETAGVRAGRFDDHEEFVRRPIRSSQVVRQRTSTTGFAGWARS